ncbi:hypothetical protein [Parvularcula lutaonensis]|uniref:Uncharacterized protein n=1 Tax=Parvularcula lutaonensis TaxID=491923 RepID=A0ABV7MBR5_9PROT|nr:hypothetical protein [Parvularcula lutaonensis]GGY48833.1 hypothetical protein GCM10007148_16660 [Parvularcula lutaonensis]
MSAWPRILVLVAAIFFAAQPAVACCLEGHADAAVQAAVSAKAPCHGEPAAPQPDGDDCPGCADCTVAQAFTNEVLQSAKSAQANMASAIAYGLTSLPPLPAAKIRNLTGPPPKAESFRPTPVTLKQRLLI